MELALDVKLIWYLVFRYRCHFKGGMNIFGEPHSVWGNSFLQVQGYPRES